MSRDWMPIRLDLLDDVAVLLIAKATNLDEYAVAGRLLKLWAWANRHLPDGVIPVTPVSRDTQRERDAHVALGEWVDRYVEAAGFADSMLAAGWLERTSDGGLAFPKFDRFNSNSAKRRLLATRRQAVSRAKSHAGGDAPCHAPGHAANTTSASTIEEKRKEEKKKTPPKPSPSPGGVVADGKEPGSKRAGPPAKRGRSRKKSDEELISPEAKPPTPRPRNPIFDAVADVTGLDPASDGAGKLIGMAAAAVAKDGYSVEEIKEFGRRFWELCDWAKHKRARPTPQELARWISLIRAPVAPGRSIGGKPDAITDLATRSLLTALEGQESPAAPEPDQPF